MPAPPSRRQDQPIASAVVTRQGARSTSSRTRIGLRAPPPQTTRCFGAAGSSGSAPTIDAAVKAVRVAAASSVARAATAAAENALRSSDFGGGTAKNGCDRTLPQRRRVDLSPRGRVAVAVDRAAGARQHEIVEKRISGAGVAGDRIPPVVDPGDVRHAADIDQHDRAAEVARRHQRAVIGGDDRRTLPARRRRPARGNQGHGDAQRPRQRRRRRRSGSSAGRRGGARWSGRGSREDRRDRARSRSRR